jgi:hypothetical protein
LRLPDRHLEVEVRLARRPQGAQCWRPQQRPGGCASLWRWTCRSWWLLSYAAQGRPQSSANPHQISPGRPRANRAQDTNDENGAQRKECFPRIGLCGRPRRGSRATATGRAVLETAATARRMRPTSALDLQFLVAAVVICCSGSPSGQRKPPSWPPGPPSGRPTGPPGRRSR